MTKLKPCPFCGGEADKSYIKYGNYYVDCINRCVTEVSEKVWNTRPQSLTEKVKIDWDILPEKIWMSDGKIVICSTLKNIPEEILTFIEDNIYEVEGGSNECIDWEKVQDEYEQWVEANIAKVSTDEVEAKVSLNQASQEDSEELAKLIRLRLKAYKLNAIEYEDLHIDICQEILKEYVLVRKNG